MSQKKLVVFLGRNTIREDGSGILAEAKAAFPWLETIVIAANDDHLLDDGGIAELLARVGVPAIEVRSFKLEVGMSYIIVANGGVNNQLVPTMGRILSSGATVEVFDLQRDGARRLWPE